MSTTITSPSTTQSRPSGTRPARFNGSQSERRSQFDNQYVSFSVGGQLLGLPVGTVQEVLNAQEIARIPRSRPEIAGLLNLRGQIVTAVNLRHCLDMPSLSPDCPPMNVVVRHQNEPFSLLVDEVGDVIDVSSLRREPMPPTLNALWKRVTTGVFRLEKQLLVVIDVASILNPDTTRSTRSRS